MRTPLVPLIFVLIYAPAAAGDFHLKATVIDTAPKDGLRSVRVDTMGRLFVGGRDAVFVYEPNDRGGYHAKRLLYRFPPDSSLNEIEILGDDLYVLTATALYLLPGGARKHESLQPRKLLWGVPKSGEMRGLAWGPEGDLYFAFGNPARKDRLAHWTFFNADNVKTPFRGPGGVLRLKADGSGLQVFARGLERPGALVFDRDWNLFVNDDNPKTFAPYWLVTPHAYLGLELPPILTGARSALTYGDDEPLPAKLRGNLLSARFDDLTRLAVKRSGASFEGTQTPVIEAKGLTSVSIGRGGRIFGILTSGEVVMYAAAGDSFAPYELGAATPAKLWQELSDTSWQRRNRAHLELLRRGGVLLKEANQRLLKANADDPALPHLIWLAARSGRGSLHLLALVEHADPKLRIQAIRALTEYPEQVRDEPIFTKSLNDPEPAVQLAGLHAHFSPKVAWNRPAQFAIERGPACSKDAYVRQSAALLLAKKATRKQLEDLCGSVDSAKRFAGVLAVGYRLTLPDATAPLAPHLPLVNVPEEACVVEYADGKLDLRERGRIGSFTVAEHWRADKRPADEELLLKLLRRMREDREARVRERAEEFLAALVLSPKPRERPVSMEPPARQNSAFPVIF